MGNYSGLFGSNLVGNFIFDGTNFVDTAGSKAMTKSGASGSATTDKFGCTNKAYNFNNNDYWYNNTIYTSEWSSGQPLSIFIVCKFSAMDTSNHLITNENSTVETQNFFELTCYGTVPSLKLTLFRWTGDSTGYTCSNLFGDYPTTNTWHIIGITQNAGSVKVIINDIYRTLTFAPGGGVGGGSYGGFTLGGSSAIKSKSIISNLILWNRELSQDEMIAISKLLLTKPIQNPHNLRAYWGA